MKLKIELKNKWGLFLLFPKADPFMMTVRYRLFREFSLLAVIIGIFSTGSVSGDTSTFLAVCRWMTAGFAAIALLAVVVDMVGELRTGRLNLVSVLAIAFLLAFAGVTLFFPW